MANRSTLSIVGLYLWDSDVFSDFTIPEDLDTDTAIREILRKCGDLELMWPDWDFMQEAIGDWSTKNAQVWQDLYDSTQFVYDPIANVDAEIRTDRSGDNSGSVTNLQEVAAYNTSTLQPEAKSTTTPATEWSDTETVTRKGNIGVTSTQELIQRQREIVQFNMYDFIADSFRTEFCLLVY